MILGEFNTWILSIDKDSELAGHDPKESCSQQKFLYFILLHIYPWYSLKEKIYVKFPEIS